MADRPSLRRRLGDDLTDDLTVSIVAVVVGVVAFVLLAASDLVDGTMLVVANVAVFVPWVYGDNWPESYPAPAAAVWTVAAALVTAGVFLGAFAVGILVLDPSIAAGGAFVLTAAFQYAIAAVYTRLRTTA